MKKILLIFLSVFVFVSVHAEITWELSDDGTLTISGTDMPNYRFSGDTTPWSSQRAKIKKVEIKDGVVNIGVNAFSNCNNVTYVTIPNSVTSIGHSAFYNCYSLTSVTIPNSVTSIGDYAFCGCSGLTSVTIPNSVTSIGNYAFSNCSSLNSADISSSVMSIGDRTFYACSRLKSIIIPNSVTSIGVSAFEDCSLISSVSIGSNVTQIGSSAFRNCNSLKNAEFANIETLCKIKFEDQLSNPLTYAHNLYIGGKIITNAIIPNSVTNIEDYTFYGCSGLTSITIPGSVTSIGNYAFCGCSGLTSVTIPQSVSSIGEYAFYGCSSLASIKFESSKLICKKESLNDLKSLKKVCVNRIEDYLNINFDETSLGNYNNQYSLALHINDQPVSELYIPEGTVSISRSAFSYFRGIKSIHIPSTLKEFGPSAFYGSGIQKVYIKDLYQWCNIDFRGNGGGSNPIYYSNASLYLDDELVETLYIPEGIKSLSDYLFTCCSSIKKVVLPSTLEKIGEWTFDATLKLKEVVCLADNPPSISSYSFNINGYSEHKDCILFIKDKAISTYKSAYAWSNFKNIQVIPAENIELNEAEEFSNDITYKYYNNINYIRDFKNTSWQSLYIPFSMTYDDWKDDFEVAFINSIRQYDNDEDGTIDETIMDVVKIKNGNLIPNTPYLIKAKSVGEKTISVNNATLYKAEENSIECSTMLAKYTFTGTYSTIPAAKLLANNYYAMGGGSLIMTDGTSDLKPFRWYLNVESRSSMYNVSSGAKAITINVVGEEETTGISQMSSDRENSSAIYDLNGRRMSQKTLKSGLYIKNGKKIIIK